MKRKLVISDSGPIFSLACINELKLLELLFEEVRISRAVWDEISLDKNIWYFSEIASFFETKVVEIMGFNELIFLMDYGESESVILYRELEADLLLIDDKKARTIAESFDIHCVGTLGILSLAKEKGIISVLKPLFERLLEHNRYYSLSLLNKLLENQGEEVIKIE